MDRLKIEYVDINSVRPYENNAKLHPEAQIEQIKKVFKNLEWMTLLAYGKMK